MLILNCKIGTIVKIRPEKSERINIKITSNNDNKLSFYISSNFSFFLDNILSTKKRRTLRVGESFIITTTNNEKIKVLLLDDKNSIGFDANESIKINRINRRMKR